MAATASTSIRNRLPGTIQFPCYMPVDVHRRLKYAALDEDRPVAAIVRDLVVEYLERHEKQAARAGRAE